VTSPIGEDLSQARKRANPQCTSAVGKIPAKRLQAAGERVRPRWQSWDFAPKSIPQRRRIITAAMLNIERKLQEISGATGPRAYVTAPRLGLM
jgi:hypothetical protein